MADIYDDYDKTLYKKQPSSVGVTEVSPEMIGSGTLLSVLDQGVGNLKNGKNIFDNSEIGFILGVDKDTAKFYIGDSTNYLNWTGSALTIAGSITATAGAIGGFDIGSDYVRDVANSMGMVSTVTAGDDVRFWAGDTYANRATAPFRVTEAGITNVESLRAGDQGIDWYDGANKRLTVSVGASQTYIQIFNDSGDNKGRLIMDADNAYSYDFDASVVNTTDNIIALSAAAHAVFGSTGIMVTFTTTGGLPGGISANTIYFTRSAGSNQIRIYPTLADAQADTNQIDITTQGTGTHTITRMFTGPAIYGNANTLLGTSGVPFQEAIINRIKLAASTTSRVPINIPAGVTPTNLTPVDGDIWYLSNSGLVFRYGTNTEYLTMSDGTTGGTGSAGAGNQYVELEINGNTYKVLHDGTV